MRELAAEGERPAIIVVDAKPLRRAALVGFLRDWAAANRVHVASSSQDSLQCALEAGARFKLGLLNLGGAPVADPESLSCLKRLVDASPEMPVAVLSDGDGVENVVAALRAGAEAFIPTSTDPAIALQALSFIMGGGSFFPPAALLERFEAKKSHLLQKDAWFPNGNAGLQSCLLTARQQAVLTHLREGRSNKTIANLLGMREATVKVHMRQIMKRLGVSNRTQAALTVAIAPPPAMPPEAAPSAANTLAIGFDTPSSGFVRLRAKASFAKPVLRPRRLTDPLAASG